MVYVPAAPLPVPNATIVVPAAKEHPVVATILWFTRKAPEAGAPTVRVVVETEMPVEKTAPGKAGGQNEPAGHGEHDDKPAAAKVPAAQATGTLTVPAHEKPAGHATPAATP
jgi:hypothetical protein